MRATLIPRHKINMLNETHDPSLTSWLASANDSAIGFPVQHLPFAVFRRAGRLEAYRPGVALGDQIIDLAQLAAIKPFSGLAAEALNTACLHTFATTQISTSRFITLRPEARFRAPTHRCCRTLSGYLSAITAVHRVS